QERDELTYFLTARFRLFSKLAGQPVTAEVEHPPWPLHHGEVLELDQSLLRAAGLPEPGHDPLVHVSPGVPTRIGMWRPHGGDPSDSHLPPPLDSAATSADPTG